MLQLDACDSWFLSQRKTLQITYPTCQQKKNLKKGLIHLILSQNPIIGKLVVKVSQMNNIERIFW